MPKRKRHAAGSRSAKLTRSSKPVRRKSSRRPQPSAGGLPALFDESQVVFGGSSLHDLFAQQAMAMLEASDLTDEQKQSALVAMSCPCCGAGGLSFTVKLKRLT